MFDTSVTVMTPAMAREYLHKNTHNRRPSETIIERYKQDMIHNRWQFTGDAIKFSRSGRLLDGQHRLMALAECPDGVSIQIIIVKGLAESAQEVMDQGKKRSAGDQLALRNIKNGTNIAAAVKLYLTWEQDLLFRGVRIAEAQISTPRIEEWVDENPGLVNVASAALSSVRNTDLAPSVGLAAAMIFTQINPTACSEFFHGLHRGAGEGHPTTALDKTLSRMRRQKVTTTQRQQLGMVFRAWNAACENRSIQKITTMHVDTEDKFPTPAGWNATQASKLTRIEFSQEDVA